MKDWGLMPGEIDTWYCKNSICNWNVQKMWNLLSKSDKIENNSNNLHENCKICIFILFTPRKAHVLIFIHMNHEKNYYIGVCVYVIASCLISKKPYYFSSVNFSTKNVNQPLLQKWWRCCCWWYEGFQLWWSNTR